jgi:hypothetical protein
VCFSPGASVGAEFGWKPAHARKGLPYRVVSTRSGHQAAPGTDRDGAGLRDAPLARFHFGGWGKATRENGFGHQNILRSLCSLAQVGRDQHAIAPARRKEPLKVCFLFEVRSALLLLPETARQSRLELSPMQTIDPEDRSSENERLEVLGLAKDPVRRRSWLLYMAQKALPFDQAIEWARTAEQFITGSPTEAHAAEARPKNNAMLLSSGGGSRRARTGIREILLQLIKDNPVALSRGEILQRLHLKGDKAGEVSVSNALTSLIKSNEVVRRDRKYSGAGEIAEEG